MIQHGKDHPGTGRTRLLTGLLAAVLLALVASTLQPWSAAANSEGDSLYTRKSTNEFVAAARVIRLEHSGAANGTLLGTFERASTDGTPSAFVLRTSKDDGRTWRTLTTLPDPLTGENHPSDRMWQPFLFELPKKMGKYPAGTLLLAGNIEPGANTRSDFVLWRSTDHGASWDFQSIVQTGGGTDGAPHGGSGVWEPFLTLDGEGRLAMFFADERRQPERAQVIAHIVSEDGGETWSANPDGSTNFEPGLVVDVESESATDRPGMPTTATLPDGRMVLAYEICGAGRNCEAYTKTSTDGGSTFGEGPADLGKMAVTSDGRYLGSSPYLVWSPAGGPNGQLMMMGMRTRYVAGNEFTPEDRQAVFVNDPDAKGPWSWTPAPFKPVEGPDKNCKTSYSPHMLLDHTGRSVRLTATTAHGGPTDCKVGTDVASSGVLPYASATAGGSTPGWIDYGGDKSIAGSTGWTDYRLEGDVRITGGSEAGLLARTSDPRDGADAHNGYYVGVTSKSVVLGKQDGSWQQLKDVAIPGGLKAGKWYRLTVDVDGCDIKVTGRPSGSTGKAVGFTHTDCSFKSGAIGVSERAGTGSWRNIKVLKS
ncbi:exo-alpha-sialidase [Streptomyces boninensis]|uniref:exo-alpha-sialidase n=1 Tax=Streptomyces boninensis TaxID=2039455 RepID=UPI003B215883